MRSKFGLYCIIISIVLGQNMHQKYKKVIDCLLTLILKIYRKVYNLIISIFNGLQSE